MMPHSGSDSTYTPVQISGTTSETLQIAEQISSIVAMILAKSDLQATAAAAAEKQIVLSEISRAISSSNDFRKTFDSTAIFIDQLIPTDRLVLITLNSDKTGYSVEVEWGLKDPNMRPGVSKRIQGTATEQAVLIGSSFILPAEQILTISRHNHPADSDPAPMNSWIASPIKIRGEVIGVIHFRSTNRWLYDRTHLDYAQQISAFLPALWTVLIQEETTPGNARYEVRLSRSTAM